MAFFFFFFFFSVLKYLNATLETRGVVSENEPALHIGFARRFYRRLNKKQRGTRDVDNKQAETAIRFIEISTGGSSTVPLYPFKDRVLADS